jgi:hypothetical protein
MTGLLTTTRLGCQQVSNYRDPTADDDVVGLSRGCQAAAGLLPAPSCPLQFAPCACQPPADMLLLLLLLAPARAGTCCCSSPSTYLLRHIGPVSVGRNCSCCSGPTHCMKVRVATEAAYRTCMHTSHPHSRQHTTQLKQPSRTACQTNLHTKLFNTHIT